MSYKTGGGGSSDSVMILIFMMIMACIASVIASGSWLLFFAPEEGDSCKGEDKNGEYEIDEDGECTFMRCKSGYATYNGVCTKDMSGDECEPLGDKDPHGVYETNLPGECTFVRCESGYGLEDGVCVEGGSGEMGEDVKDGDECTIQSAIAAKRWEWKDVRGDGQLYCTLVECEEGYNIVDNTCVRDGSGTAPLYDELSARKLLTTERDSSWTPDNTSYSNDQMYYIGGQYDPPYGIFVYTSVGTKLYTVFQTPGSYSGYPELRLTSQGVLTYGSGVTLGQNKSSEHTHELYLTNDGKLVIYTKENRNVELIGSPS